MTIEGDEMPTANEPYLNGWDGSLDLHAFQGDVASWADANFGVVEPRLPFLGMVEELGELAHAMLKHEQSIRGMEDEAAAQAAVEDAIGDLCVFMANFCAKSGFSLELAILKTWRTVRARNWKLFPGNGVSE